MSTHDIATFERNGSFNLKVANEDVTIDANDAEVISEDILYRSSPTRVASPSLSTSKYPMSSARRASPAKFINRIQNIRKDSGFDVTDKIIVKIQPNNLTDKAVTDYADYIAAQTLAKSVSIDANLNDDNAQKVELDDDLTVLVSVTKI